MRLSRSILVVFVLVQFACDRDLINPAEETFRFYETATLIEGNPYATQGDKMVFHHYYRAQHEGDTSAAGYVEELFFELEQNDHFSFEGDMLQSLNFNFQQYCNCATFDEIQVVNGYLNGERKSNDKYLIEANVELIGYSIYEGDTLASQVIHSAFTGTFKKSVLPTEALN